MLLKDHPARDHTINKDVTPVVHALYHNSALPLSLLMLMELKVSTNQATVKT